MANGPHTTRRRLPFQVGCLLAPLAIALVLPASSQAAWTTPINLSGAGQDASSPRVAVDPNGNAVFVWQRDDGTADCGGSPCSRIQARARSAAGVLSAVLTLSPAGKWASRPRVAIDASGNAVFVWERWDGATSCPCLAEARARSAAGTLSPIQQLSVAGPYEANLPNVGVDQSGNAVFAWQRAGVIESRVRSGAGVLSAIQTISPPAQQAYIASDLAVDSDGDAVFVWAIYDPTLNCGEFNCYRTQTRVRSATGSLTPIQNLSAYANGQNAVSPKVAVDPTGNAVFVWTLAGDPDCFCDRIQARARSAAGTLSGAPILTPTEADASAPQLGVDQSGNAVFTWTRLDDGTTDCGGFGCSRIQARARSAAGALSTTQALSEPGRQAQLSDVAVNPDGNAVFVWTSNDGTTGCPSNPYGPGCLRIQARARSAAGTLDPIQTLSDAGQNVHFGAQVGMTQNGNAAAVWSRFGGANWRVQAAAGP
jgi:hypothetical protein